MAENVKATVASNPVVLFTKTHCGHCVTAKSTIAKALEDPRLGAVKPVVVNLDSTVGASAIGGALVAMTGARVCARRRVRGRTATLCACVWHVGTSRVCPAPVTTGCSADAARTPMILLRDE